MSYPDPRVPNEPRNERSLRTLDAFTCARSASCSDETVEVPALTSSCRIRWYTGKPGDGRLGDPALRARGCHGRGSY